MPTVPHFSNTPKLLPVMVGAFIHFWAPLFPGKGTKANNTLTVRYRDSVRQDRIPVDKVREVVNR